MATLASLTVKILGDTGHLVSQLELANKKSTSFVDKMNRMRGPLLAIGAAATGMAGVSLKAFGDFDDAMNQSLAIMGDVSEAQRKEMSDAARQMAKETRFSATQAAESYFYLASAGLSAQASVSALPAVAAFAQAGMFDMARATDLLTDAQSALGLTIRDDAVANMENMVAVSDVLVKANTLANASVEQFSEALTTKAGAALRLVGKDVEEGVAVLAAFADQGIKGSEAGTQLGIVLRDLQTKAIKNKASFAEMGVTVFDAAGNMQNMSTIIGSLERALVGMSDEQAKATLLQLGFSDKSVASIQALLGLSKQIAIYEDQLRDAGGVTQEVADKQLESFKAQIDLARSGVMDAAISLGAVFAPVVIVAARKVAELAGKFAEMPKPVLYAVASTIALTIALSALGLMVGPMAAGFGALTAAWGLAAVAANFLTGGIFAMTGATTALNVVTGGLILAVGALIAGLILMILNWDKTVRAFKIGVNALIWLAETWVNAYLTPINLIIKAWNVLGKMIGKQVDEIDIHLGRLDTSVKQTADKVDESTGNIGASFDDLGIDIAGNVDQMLGDMDTLTNGFIANEETIGETLAEQDAKIIAAYKMHVDNIKAFEANMEANAQKQLEARERRIAKEIQMEIERKAALDALYSNNGGGLVPGGYAPVFPNSGPVYDALREHFGYDNFGPGAQGDRDRYGGTPNSAGNYPGQPGLPNIGPSDPHDQQPVTVQVVIDNRVVAEAQGEVAMSEGATP